MLFPWVSQCGGVDELPIHWTRVVFVFLREEHRSSRLRGTIGRCQGQPSQMPPGSLFHLLLLEMKVAL